MAAGRRIPGKISTLLFVYFDHHHRDRRQVSPWRGDCSQRRVVKCIHMSLLLLVLLISFFFIEIEGYGMRARTNKQVFRMVEMKIENQIMWNRFQISWKWLMVRPFSIYFNWRVRFMEDWRRSENILYFVQTDLNYSWMMFWTIWKIGSLKIKIIIGDYASVNI